MTAPSAWQAAVIRRKPGITASSAGRKLPRVRTAVGCTGIGSTTIMAAPPRALAR